MDKNKLFMAILAILLCTSPCYADAGIPLWVFSNSSALIATGIQWREGFVICVVVSLILLIAVSLIETVVIKFVLKIRKFQKAFKITLKANVISTVIGAVLTFFIINNETITSWLWWNNKWFIISNLGLHIFMLIVSYFVEYNVAKRELTEYKDKDINKSFLYANILSYIIFPFLIIGLIVIYDYVNSYQYKQYEKLNYKNLDSVEVLKSAFIPEPLSKKECKKLKKTLGITAACDAEIDYWAGAVLACSGVEHMYSQNQMEEIIKEIYQQKLNHVEGKPFNAEIAKKYGLPVDFLSSNYHANVWSNKAFNTNSPYVMKLYSNSGDFQSRRYDVDEFAKTYAICINNK